MQSHDTVHMIRHHDKFIAFNTRIMTWQSVPHRLNDGTELVGPHFSADNLPKQTRTILSHDRDEIRTRLRVIVIAQPNRPATWSIWVELHRSRYLNVQVILCNCIHSTVGAGLKPARGAVDGMGPVRAGQV